MRPARRPPAWAGQSFGHSPRPIGQNGLGLPRERRAMPQAPIWERDGTLGAIERLLSEAQEGRGRSLFIVAEAGLGKTTMVERAYNAPAGSFRIGVGRGDAAESSLPFGTIDQALRGLGF